MNATELRTLNAQKEKLSEEITKLTDIYNRKKLRACVSACVEKPVNGTTAVRRHDHFLLFHSQQEIPPEFMTFIENYCQRLIAERLAIWGQIQGRKIVIQ